MNYTPPHIKPPYSFILYGYTYNPVANVSYICDKIVEKPHSNVIENNYTMRSKSIFNSS